MKNPRWRRCVLRVIALRPLTFTAIRLSRLAAKSSYRFARAQLKVQRWPAPQGQLASHDRHPSKVIGAGRVTVAVDIASQSTLAIRPKGSSQHLNKSSASEKTPAAAA